jgi:hypothetical protein
MSQVPPGNSGGPKRRRLAATAARRRLTVVVSYGPRAQPDRDPCRYGGNPVSIGGWVCRCSKECSARWFAFPGNPSRCVRRGGCPMNGFPGSRDGWCFGNQRARHRLGYAARRGLGHGSMVCLDRLAADCGGQSGGELAGREAILGQVGDGYRPGGEEAEGAGLRLRGRTRPPRQPYRRPPVSLGSRLGAAGWRGCRAGRLAAVCHDVRQRRLPRAYDGLSCRRTG